MKNCFNCEYFDESNYIFVRCKCSKTDEDTFEKYIESSIET